MVIAIGNQKGGVGKTTLAILFSNFLIENKKELLVLDFDFQSSFYNSWKDETDLKEETPPYDVLEQELENAPNVVGMLKDTKDDIVILDLPGKLDDDNLIPLFNVTDVILIPFSYDKLCFESTIFFVQLLKHIRKDIRIVFIPNRIKTGVKYTTKSQIDQILETYGTITEVIPDRVCLQRHSVITNSKEIKEVVDQPFQSILKLLK